MRITPTRIRALPITVSRIEHCTYRLLKQYIIKRCFTLYDYTNNKVEKLFF